jgi:hypothetical protein
MAHLEEDVGTPTEDHCSSLSVQYLHGSQSVLFCRMLPVFRVCRFSQSNPRKLWDERNINTPFYPVCRTNLGVVELNLFLPKTFSRSQKQILYETLHEMTTVVFRIIGNKLLSSRCALGKNIALAEGADFFILFTLSRAPNYRWPYMQVQCYVCLIVISS